MAINRKSNSKKSTKKSTTRKRVKVAETGKFGVGMRNPYGDGSYIPYHQPVGEAKYMNFSPKKIANQSGGRVPRIER